MDRSYKTIVVPTKGKELSKGKKFRVALIAHDAKKVDMLAFASKNEEFLKKCDLIATKGTGHLINKKIGLEVKEMMSGPEGGDLQIGGLVASEEINLVIFLRDPLAKQPHDPDIAALMKVCDVHDIPLATNLSSAEILLRGIIKQTEKKK
ncbi:MAG TPA: methylglyoxal synthase [Candidatus Atribacteria bacterium]|jgi:methylglyoxal synthase|nr:methylglyoxal synthase [Candidatus Atribacteria bacterium]